MPNGRPRRVSLPRHRSIPSLTLPAVPEPSLPASAWRLLCALALALLLAGPVAPAQAAPPALDFDTAPAGEPAPAFALPPVGGGAAVAGDTLYDVASLTMLTFWTTHCAECVRRLEICQGLSDWGVEAGLSVIGVNFDDQPSSSIERLSRSATPRLLQLYDEGGMTASLFGAGAHSFSVYLVDPMGTILATGYEISADSLEALRPQLSRLLGTEPMGEGETVRQGEGASAGGPAVPASGAAELLKEVARLREERLRVEGVGRVRWMNIDTTGVGATGPTGEEVEPGTSLRHRLELQLITRLSSRITVGGLLWLSNEGEAVLRSGPDYLSSSWGSAFIRATAAPRLPLLGASRAALRAGYYEAAFTPLTLMRWDKDDSPISGGQKLQGCGVCGGEAGVSGFVRTESVEKLAPEYLFEGARADLALGRYADLVLLYARPHEHWLGGESNCFTADQELMRYREHLYSGRLTGHLSLPYTPDLLRVSGTALWVRDETEGWPCGSKRPEYEPSRTRLLGADARLPLPGRSELAAEIVRSRWEPLPEDPLGAAADTAVSANAAQAFWRIDWMPGGGRQWLPLAGPSPFAGGLTVRAQAGYQRIGSNYYAPYSALSYEANLRLAKGASLPGLAGPRGSLRLEWGPFGLGVFAKRLEPVDEEADMGIAGETPAGTRRMASVWADLLLWPGGTLMGGWVRDDRDPLKTQRVYRDPGDNESAVPAENRSTRVVSFEQELWSRCLLILEAQWISGERVWEGAPPGLPEAEPEEYESRTLRAMVDVEF